MIYHYRTVILAGAAWICAGLILLNFFRIRGIVNGAYEKTFSAQGGYITSHYSFEVKYEQGVSSTINIGGIIAEYRNFTLQQTN